jgi:hypothetical protein
MLLDRCQERLGIPADDLLGDLRYGAGYVLAPELSDADDRFFAKTA